MKELIEMGGIADADHFYKTWEKEHEKERNKQKPLIEELEELAGQMAANRSRKKGDRISLDATYIKRSLRGQQTPKPDIRPSAMIF
jgi:hypothetical protein